VTKQSQENIEVIGVSVGIRTPATNVTVSKNYFNLPVISVPKHYMKHASNDL
jgi:hypothetical protein